MCISKILTDLCVIKQKKTKIKNIFANVVYNVLVVKKYKETCLKINGKQSIKLKSVSIDLKIISTN